MSWRSGKASTSFELVEAGDSRRMTVKSIGDPWTAEEARTWIAEALGPCEWVHVAPLLRDEFCAATLAEIARDRFVSLDGQGLARSPVLGPLVLDGDYDRELLRHVTVLKLAEEEAIALLGEVSAASLATLELPEVVVTRGTRGALVYYQGELTAVPARPVVTNAETTGAGDEFAAIYLAARARGRSPAVAARRAAVFVGALLSRRLPAT